MVPALTLIDQETSTRSSAVQQLFQLPDTVFGMVTSLKTGAYLKRVAKDHELNEQQLQALSKSVLDIALGNLAPTQHAPTIAKELKVSTDMAHKLSSTLEKDLFAPIALDLNKPRRQQSTPTSDNPPPKPPNVLNLKDQQSPPAPPRIDS